MLSSLGAVWRSLAGRIWVTDLTLLTTMALLIMVSALSLPVLERSVNSVLLRNYRSIAAAEHMRASVVAYRSGDATLQSARAEFDRWLEVESHNITEPGEAELARTIGHLAGGYFASSHLDDKRLLNALNQLVAMNERAMFSADRRTVEVARRLRREVMLLSLAAVLVLIMSSYMLSRGAVRPLNELTRLIGSVNNQASLRALRPQKLTELGRLTDEFNAMVERLQAGYRRRVEELDRERAKTAAIIESIEDGLIVLDPAQVIVHINEVACAILSLDSPGELLGRVIGQAASRNTHLEHLTEVLGRESEEAAVEFKVFLRGRDHTYLLRALPWTSDSQRLPERDSSGEEWMQRGTIVLLQDVTLIRDQERAHVNLIATMSHELKTPLTSLAIGSELLSESMPAQATERQNEILGTIRDDVRRLQTIADSLLDASRSTAARIAVERRPILWDNLLEQICRPLAIQAEEKEIEFELTLGCRPAPIWGDPIKLPWVVTNLVGNALRYTPAGGKISVRLTSDHRRARLVVADTGTGVRAEEVAQIFEPYASFADSPARAGAAGLGLYIAKEIVEAHNGRIYLKNDRGATFTVEIPLREEALG